jgi:cytidylate kinase
MSRDMNAHFDDVLADIRSRDARDSCREVAPLKPASDSVLLDTSALDPEQAVAEAFRLADERLARV